jgi:ATP-dependent DNA helicase PIF1
MHDQASLFANPMDSDDIDRGRNPATNVTGGKRQSEDPVKEDKQSKRQNISSTETIPNNGSSSSLASSITTSNDQRFQLSFTQKEALEIIMSRKSVFFTGAAGTGKSYILKIFRQAIQTLNMAWRVGITAPTGIAACNIGGVTLHSWAGIFNEKAHLMEVMIPAILKNKQALSRWRETEILVIDEVSMLSNILFERLNIIAQTIRRNRLPFGGIQLVLCGDFLQLPPVGLGQPFDRSASTLTQLDQIVGFCFESPTWKQIFGDYDPLAIDFLPQSHLELPGRVILLQKVFRQKDDQQFLEILHSLRLGQPSEAACRVLRQKVLETLQRREQEEMEREQILPTPGSQQNLDKIEATKLFCVNHDVDHFNQLELDKIDGDVDRTHSHPGEDDDNQRPQRYKSIEWGVPQYVAQLAKDTKAPKSLVLKVGAQVMLLKNLSTATGLVNGARGVVVAFETCDDPHFSRVPVVKFRTIVDGKDGEQTIRIGHAKWEVVLRGK